MGAWGEGMQANDTALDAIPFFEKDEDIPKYTKEQVNEMISQYKSDFSNESKEILGLAEWFLDLGIDRSWLPLNDIESAIEYELESANLERWRSPETRKDALLNFRNRIRGSDSDDVKDKTEYHNRGLFQRINERE